MVECESLRINMLQTNTRKNLIILRNKLVTCMLQFRMLSYPKIPIGKTSEILSRVQTGIGRIPRGIGGILGLILPEMCFPGWDAIGF